MKIQDVLKEFGEQLTEFASTGIVLRVEGTTVASVAEEGIDGEAGDAYLAEIVKLNLIAQAQLGIASETEDIFVSSALGTALARPLEDTPYIWTVLVGANANADLTRAVMRAFHERVVEALP